MLKPQRGGKMGQTIVYDLREGRKNNLDIESSEDEWSVESDSSYSGESSSYEGTKMSSLDVMGIVLKEQPLRVSLRILLVVRSRS